MRHVHLFELEDQAWFPGVLREPITDFLSFAGELTASAYAPFAARLHQAMATSGERRLVDLCSGGGGPARTIARLLRDEQRYPVELVLTDLYPNVAQWQRAKDASPGEVDFISDPVDATRVPHDLPGFRLLCNGFHHFRPAEACAVLRDAVVQRRGIAIFEAFDPGPAGLPQPLFLVPMMLGVTPFLRPFRWSRLLFTYVLPAVPVSLLWDGLVSWLRVYAADELRELCASVASTHPDIPYDWEIGRARLPMTPARATFLIGTPALTHGSDRRPRAERGSAER